MKISRKNCYGKVIVVIFLVPLTAVYSQCTSNTCNGVSPPADTDPRTWLTQDTVGILFTRQQRQIDSLTAELNVVQRQLAQILQQQANGGTSDPRVDQLNQVVQQLNCDFKGIYSNPADCSDFAKAGNSMSKVYPFVLSSIGGLSISTSVYCDMTTAGGGWLVIQRRTSGLQNFSLSWSEYENGFGNVSNEFWLGNSIVYRLTKYRNYTLRIDAKGSDGSALYAEYSQFSIGTSCDGYRLTISGYTGNLGELLSASNGTQFSTYDQDNSGKNCPQSLSCGWWFSGYCSETGVVNGLYSSRTRWGIQWAGGYVTLDTIELKIRPSFYLPPLPPA